MSRASWLFPAAVALAALGAFTSIEFISVEFPSRSAATPMSSRELYDRAQACEDWQPGRWVYVNDGVLILRLAAEFCAKKGDGR